MKRYLYLLMFVTGVCTAQEFTIHSNGLIYDPSTMTRLAHIVDSLNLKFRTCDLAHPYYSYPQGFATFVDVPSKAALKLIEGGATLEEYTRAFGKSVNQRQWVVKSNYSDHRDNEVIEYSGLPYGYGHELSLVTKRRLSGDKTRGWVLDDQKTEAIFLEDLSTTAVPHTYARLVQYVDCMIDTTATVYLAAASSEIYQEVKPGSKADQFLNWVKDFENEPAFPDYESLEEEDYRIAREELSKKHDVWDSLRLLYVDKKMATGHYWKSMLMDARDEALSTGNTDNELEFYVARYLSKADALQLKRSRKVMGYCSQDLSPRYHAVGICQLAAETAKWDIFLRSHLDIMNDRFERQSDGSYAWAERRTYLRELEKLDIYAIDLLLGTSLRVTNVSDHHYFSSIGRVGRALADVADKDSLEQQLITMMSDTRLDVYNRLLMAYVFDNYAWNLEDEVRKKASLKKLKDVVDTMPQAIRDIWNKG